MFLLLLFAAAFGAGAVNSIAGGGTLLTFPSLLAYGVPSITANATSTVALVPGSFSAFLGFRGSKHAGAADEARFVVVSAVGGLGGAWLLLQMGDATFTRIVPWLIFGATGLFLVQEPLSRRLHRRAAGTTEAGADASEADEPSGFSWPLLACQLVIGVYGGLFGAGSGILMLAALGFFGLRDMHRMNRLKNLANVAWNSVASITFVVGRHVDVKLALIMMVGAIVGGYGGAGFAKRLGQANVKRVVIVVGVGIGGYTLAKAYG